MEKPTLNKKIGQRIAKLRKLAALTQNQLSEKSQCSSVFISRLERGVCAASVKRLDLIAKALDIPLKALFDFGEEQKKKEYIEEFIIFKRSKDGELIRERYDVYQSSPGK